MPDQECPVCEYPYDTIAVKPMSGRCGHSICKICRRNQRRRNFECPICKEEESFVDESPNLSLIRMLERMKLAEEEQNEEEEPDVQENNAFRFESDEDSDRDSPLFMYRSSLFVKGISKNWDNDRLYMAFGRCGTIRHCKIERDENGESMGCATVYFAEPEAADTVKTRMKGAMVGNRRLSFEVTVLPEDSVGDMPEYGPQDFSNDLAKTMACANDWMSGIVGGMRNGMSRRPIRSGQSSSQGYDDSQQGYMNTMRMLNNPDALLQQTANVRSARPIGGLQFQAGMWNTTATNVGLQSSAPGGRNRRNNNIRVQALPDNDDE